MTPARLLGLVLLIAVPASAAGPRGAPPPAGPPPEARVPEVQQFELTNELKVLLVSDSDLALVQVSILFPDAARAEAANQRGLAALTARAMLFGGVVGWDQDVELLTERTEGLTVVATDSYVGFSFSCFPRDLRRVLEEFSFVLSSPALEKRKVQSMIASAAASLAGRRASAGAVGSERVRKLVLKWHREEIDAEGSEATLLSLTPQTVRTFHETWFRPDHATVLVVGDIIRLQLEETLTESLVGWELADVPAADLEPLPLPQPVDRRVVLLHRPDVVQSRLFVAATAPPAGSEELAAAALLAEILGGGIDCRLNRVLREQQADTYGLSAYHEVMPDAGILWMSGAVDGEATADAVEQVLGILDDLGETLVPADELRSAQAVLEGRVMRGAATTAGLIGQMQVQMTRGRDPAALLGWIEELRAVTAEDVRATAAKWLGADVRTILVVGDAGRIGESLQSLGMKVETKYRKGEQPAQ